MNALTMAIDFPDMIDVPWETAAKERQQQPMKPSKIIDSPPLTAVTRKLQQVGNFPSLSLL